MRPHRIDESKCTECGLCEEICPDVFTLLDGRVQYDPEGKCNDCGHCVAVCPEGALVREDGSVPPAVDPAVLPDPASLLDFLRSRRSTRRFRPEVPPRDLLERLVDAARFAPTGSNRQDVRIVMVTDPDRLEALRSRIMARCGDYERHLASPVKRLFLSRLVDRRLGEPAIRDYLKSFVRAYRDGRDPLFHGAPVVAFLHTGTEATTPKDDCGLALYHMILMAERLGLGSCFLGTVEIAFSRTASLNDLLRIPRGRPLLASACFGYPEVTFHRLVDRKPAAVSWL